MRRRSRQQKKGRSFPTAAEDGSLIWASPASAWLAGISGRNEDAPNKDEDKAEPGFGCDGLAEECGSKHRHDQDGDGRQCIGIGKVKVAECPEPRAEGYHEQKKSEQQPAEYRNAENVAWNEQMGERRNGGYDVLEERVSRRTHRNGDRQQQMPDLPAAHDGALFGRSAGSILRRIVKSHCP